jgi:hypothetical protein
MRLYIRVIQCSILESRSGIRVIKRVIERPHLVLFVRDHLPRGGICPLLLVHLRLDQLLVRIYCLQVQLLVDVCLYEALVTLRVEARVEGTAGGIDCVLKLDTTFLIRIVTRDNWNDSWVLHVH